MLNAFPAVRSDPFLVVYSDVYWGLESTMYTELLADSTPKLAAGHVADAGAFGRVETVRKGDELWLVRLREKDGAPTPGLVNGGAYLLPESVGVLLAGLPVSIRGEVEFTDALTQYVADGGRIRVCLAEEWSDLGTVERLDAANRPVPTSPNRHDADGAESPAPRRIPRGRARS